MVDWFPESGWKKRFRSFEAGEWESLVLQSMPGVEQAAIFERQEEDVRERTGDVERRAARAVRLVPDGRIVLQVDKL